MPNYKTHQHFAILLIGLAIFDSILIYQYNLGKLTFINLVSLLGISLFFSVLPDIDSRASFVRNITYLILWTSVFLITIMLLLINYSPTSPYSFAILSKISELKLLVIQSILSLVGLGILFLKHRGIMHTYYAGALLAFPLYFINIMYAVTGFVVYSSHILLDGVIKNGRK